MIDVTDRDKSIITFCTFTGWALGVWNGIFLVPDAALTVPKRVENGETLIAYQPVPTWLPLITLLVLGGAAYFAYVFATRDDDGEDVEHDDDGDRDKWGVTDD